VDAITTWLLLSAPAGTGGGEDLRVLSEVAAAALQHAAITQQAMGKTSAA
jgi:hypothetical protein